jgi:DNA repair protein RecO (recombination protein O)
MRSDNTPAVVLRTRPLGEADLIVILLTAEFGKLDTAATKARSSVKRFSGGLTPGARGVATVARGRGALARLEKFESSADHAPIGADLTRFAYVAYLCELTDELVQPHHADPELFAALCHALALVIEGAPRAVHLRRYELALLRCLGFLADFDACCVCGRAVATAGEGTVAFDGSRGGLLCDEHGHGAPRLAAAAAAAIRHLEADGDPASVDAAPPAVRKALRDAIQAILRPHLRRALQSQAFFAALPREGGGEGV